MKTLSITIKTMVVLLLAGALFFSCDIADPDTGTLVISVPGSGSARAGIADIKNYRVVCQNDNNEIIKDFNGSTSLSLSPGNWFVTITALDKEKEGIGYGGKEISIKAGETKTFPVNLYLWTHFNINLTTLDGLEVPVGTTAVYATDDPRKYSYLQSKYKHPGFSTPGFNEFFAVVLKCDDDRENTYNDLLNQITTIVGKDPDKDDTVNNNSQRKRWSSGTLGNSGSTAIDLDRPKGNNYIIIAIRKW